MNKRLGKGGAVCPLAPRPSPLFLRAAAAAPRKIHDPPSPHNNGYIPPTNERGAIPGMPEGAGLSAGHLPSRRMLRPRACGPIGPWPQQAVCGLERIGIPFPLAGLTRNTQPETDLWDPGYVVD